MRRTTAFLSWTREAAAPTLTACRGQETRSSRGVRPGPRSPSHELCAKPYIVGPFSSATFLVAGSGYLPLHARRRPRSLQQAKTQPARQQDSQCGWLLVGFCRPSQRRGTSLAVCLHRCPRSPSRQTDRRSWGTTSKPRAVRCARL